MKCLPLLQRYSSSVPRACGDDPMTELGALGVTVRSPRMWG